MSDYRDNKIQALSNGTILVEYGPMRMFISAYEKGKPLISLSKEGGDLAIKVLEDLARFLPVIRRKTREIEIKEPFPPVVRKMVEATGKMGAPDLTPMAAVAGAASEVVADFMISRGGTKIIVDNGGDIAIRLREGEVAKVGIKTEIDAKYPSYVVLINFEMGVGGVATSGLGGRSFTKGIASAATIFSRTASVADAAATVIGNFTDTEDPGIKRSLAQRICPDTDIAGEWVTIEVGELSEEKIEEALKKGLSKAYSLHQKGLIHGALVAVKGKAAWTHFLDGPLIKL